MSHAFLPIDMPRTFGDLPVFSSVQSAMEFWNALPIWQQILIGGILGFLGLLVIVDVF